MIKSLVISNNICFIQKLINEINVQNLNININHISTNETDIANITLTDFDIIFYDLGINKPIIRLLLENCKDNLVLMSEEEIFTAEILEKITNLMELKDFTKKKERVVKELSNLGYNFEYKGTQYLTDTILQIYTNQSKIIDSLQSGIYPAIAKHYKKTVHNVKASINRATECMYFECDAEKLKQYFNFSTDIKPTVKQVVFTVIGKL